MRFLFNAIMKVHKLLAGLYTQFAVKIFTMELQCVFFDIQLLHNHIGSQTCYIAIKEFLLFAC